MREDGIENFLFEVEEECFYEDNLIEREQYYINYYNSIVNGYNMRLDNNSIKTTSQEIINMIKNDLSNSNLTQLDISKKYNVSHSLVSQINSGKMHYDKTIQYPIRPMLEKGKKNYCIDCGKEILLTSTRCPECSIIAKRKVNRPDREELKVLIREKSFAEIGRIYGITDNTVRKWCKGYNLPSKKAFINQCSDEDWEKEIGFTTSEILTKPIKKNINYTQICETYNRLKSCIETAKECNCSLDTVSKALKENNIIIMSTSEKSSKKIEQWDLEGKYIQTFESTRAAARFLKEQGIAKGAESGIASHLGEVAMGKRKTAYKYIWKYSFDKNF